MDNIRKMALYLFFNKEREWEQLELSSWHEAEFIVNERSVRHGDSVNKIMREAEYAHEILAQIDMDAPTIDEVVQKFFYAVKTKEGFEDIQNLLLPLEGNDHQCKLKECLYGHFSKKYNDGDIKKASDRPDIIHREVNLLYHIFYWYNDEVKEYSKLIQDAFNGKKIEEYRSWSKTDDGNYLVLTDSEADNELDKYLEEMLDDEGIVPGADSPYFDREAWKKDAEVDGRAHFLARWDGEEHTIDVSVVDHPYLFDEAGESPEDGESTTFYIYRTN